MFEFLTPLVNVFSVFDDLKFASLDLIVLLLSFSEFTVLLLFLFLLNFFLLVILNLFAELFHLFGTLFLFVPGHAKTLVTIIALGIATGTHLPSPAALVHADCVLDVG